MLVVHLLRTYWDPKRWDPVRKAKGAVAKVHGKVDFDEELDLTEFNEKQKGVKYRLHGVILHRGESVLSGHYIAVVRCPDSEDFCLVNDSYAVAPSSLADILARQAKRDFEPYALLYQIFEAEVEDGSEAESGVDGSDEHDAEEDGPEATADT